MDQIQEERQERHGNGRGSVLDGLFFVFLFFFLARKSRYQGTKRKVQNEARKMGQKNNKTKKKSPKVERLVTQRVKWGCWAREVTECPPALRVLAVKTWLCLVLSLSGF